MEIDKLLENLLANADNVNRHLLDAVFHYSFPEKNKINDCHLFCN